jgi:hypothetical protein
MLGTSSKTKSPPSPGAIDGDAGNRSDEKTERQEGSLDADGDTRSRGNVPRENRGGTRRAAPTWCLREEPAAVRRQVLLRQGAGVDTQSTVPAPVPKAA